MRLLLHTCRWSESLKYNKLDMGIVDCKFFSYCGRLAVDSDRRAFTYLMCISTYAVYSSIPRTLEHNHRGRGQSVYHRALRLNSNHTLEHNHHPMYHPGILYRKNDSCLIIMRTSSTMLFLTMHLENTNKIVCFVQLSLPKNSY